MPDPAYTVLTFPPRIGVYRVLPLEVIDGDTLRFAWLVDDVCRLRGINAPEMTGASKAAGLAAKEFLREKVGSGKVLLFKADKREKYGRALGDLFDGDVNLNRLMVESGHAAPYLETR